MTDRDDKWQAMLGIDGTTASFFIPYYWIPSKQLITRFRCHTVHICDSNDKPQAISMNFAQI